MDEPRPGRDLHARKLHSHPECKNDNAIDADGVVDQDDLAYLVEAIAGGANPTGRDLDFNRDGSGDQDDIALLVGVIAGGTCP